MNHPMSAVIADRGHRQPRPASGAIRSCLSVRSDAVAGVEIAVFDDLHTTEELWRDFEGVADCTVFQSFGYLAAWHEHIGKRGATRPAIVVLRRDRNTLAIMPLGIDAKGMFRRLAWLGQDVGDYLGPLLARDFARSVSPSQFVSLWSETLRLLQSQPPSSSDVVTLCKMPARIGEQTNPFMALPVARHPSDGFFVTLESPWSDFYLARRSSKARRQDKSKRARLRESGDLQITAPPTGEAVGRTIDMLLAQKSAVFARKGIADPFQRPGYREFFQHLAGDPGTRELVHVSRLDVGGEPAAINLGLEYRGRYSLCLVSYDEKFARFSPGAIHLNELIRRAVEHGLHEFDFLVGLQRLKREWSDRRIELYDHVTGVTARGRIGALILRSLNRIKRTVKSSPTLWGAFLRMREATAPLRNPSRLPDD